MWISSVFCGEMWVIEQGFLSNEIEIAYSLLWFDWEFTKDPLFSSPSAQLLRGKYIDGMESMN